MRWKFHLYYVVTGETRAIPFLMYLWKLLQKLSLFVAIGMTTSNKYKTNLKKGKSKSLFKLNEIKDDDDVIKGSFNGLRRGSSQTLKLGACNVKSFFSEAANKMSLQLPTHKNLIQKLFPADFSSRPETVKHEDFNEGWCELDCMLCTVVTYGFTHVSVWEQVYIHVYKLKDSDLGFYHTGIEVYGTEFTYCCDRGIVRHRPRRSDMLAMFDDVQNRKLKYVNRNRLICGGCL